MPQPYEITHTLVLSTAHISKADRDVLRTGESPLVIYDKKAVDSDESYGFWIDVPDPEDGFNSDEQILAAGYSEAITGILALARKLKCQWVMLDRDGPRCNDLPQFEW